MPDLTLPLLIIVGVGALAAFVALTIGAWLLREAAEHDTGAEALGDPDPRIASLRRAAERGEG